MEDERIEIKKEIEKEKEKDAKIASLKIVVQSLQQQLAAAKNLPESPGSTVSQADAPEPIAGTSSCRRRIMKKYVSKFNSVRIILCKILVLLKFLLLIK